MSIAMAVGSMTAGGRPGRRPYELISGALELLRRGR